MQIFAADTNDRLYVASLACAGHWHHAGANSTSRAANKLLMVIVGAWSRLPIAGQR